MKELTQNLLWPAAAGNVGWAFFQLAVEYPGSGESVVPRLISLALLFYYLASEWQFAFRVKGEEDIYWVADWFLIAALVTYSILTQSGRDESSWALAAVFFVALTGHVTEAWMREGYKAGEKWAFAGANALGLLLLLCGFFVPEHRLEIETVAIAVTLGAWYTADLKLRRPNSKSVPK